MRGEKREGRGRKGRVNVGRWKEGESVASGESRKARGEAEAREGS